MAKATKTNKRHSVATKKAVLDAYFAGTSTRDDIAAKYGVSTASINNWAASPKVLAEVGYKPSEEREQSEPMGATAASGKPAKASKRNKSPAALQPAMTLMQAVQLVSEAGIICKFCPSCGNNLQRHTHAAMADFMVNHQ